MRQLKNIFQDNFFISLCRGFLYKYGSVTEREWASIDFCDLLKFRLKKLNFQNGEVQNQFLKKLNLRNNFGFR